MTTRQTADKKTAGGLTGYVRTNSKWLFFWSCAAVMLFLNLWMDSISGSEGRWIEIVREMFLNKSFLHPMINWEPYFDKPLVSYWFIAFFAWLNGGVVNEFIARIPSALAALAVLWATISIARTYWDEYATAAAAWIMLSVYCFPFWGRLAEADMLNLAFSTLAVAWYLRRKEHTDIFSYALFWALCAIGGQTKGLGAIVIPAMVAGIDMLVSRSWKKHLNWKMPVGVIIGVLLYFIPFVLSSVSKGDYSANGLYLVFRENIQRFFDPFDHKDEPFFIYFRHVSQLFLPWTPFLVLAVIKAVMDWKKSGDSERWLLLATAAIFVVFSASGSRRIYYILPIIPFCAIITGLFITSSANSVFGKLKILLLRIMDYAFPVASILLIISPTAWFITLKFLPFEMPRFMVIFTYIAAPVTGLIFTAAYFRMRKLEHEGRLWNFANGLPLFTRTVILTTLTMIVVFSIVLPVVDNVFRTEKPFLVEVGAKLKNEYKLKPENIAFYQKTYINATYYLGFNSHLAVFEDNPETDVKESPEAMLRDALAKAAEKNAPLAVIGEKRYFAEIKDEKLRDSIIGNPTLAEKENQWENKKNFKKKLIIKIFPAGNRGE